MAATKTDDTPSTEASTSGADALPDKAAIAKKLSLKITVLDAKGKPLVRGLAAGDILSVTRRGGVTRCVTADGRKHEVAL